MRESPFVCAVTLNWNGAAFLKECVDSVLASDYPHFRVVVVDNGSTDDSLRLLEELYASNAAVTVVRNQENLGYSRGMNIGLEHGFKTLGADHCLVMNNDTQLDKQAITALVEAAETHPHTGFVTGKVYYYDHPDTLQTVGKKTHPILINGGHIGQGETDSGQYDRDQELAFCDDIFWLVTRGVYDETGGYDPEFFLQAEDFDWQLRAKKAGYKILYAHRARIWHRESMTLGKSSPRKAFYDFRNPLVAVMKNCEPRVVRKYLKTKIVRMQFPAIIKRLAKGQFATACAMFRGLCSALAWKIKHP